MILTISDNYKEKRVMPTDALMGYYIQAKINMNPCIMKKNTQHDIYTYTFMMEAKKKKSTSKMSPTGYNHTQVQYK